MSKKKTYKTPKKTPKTFGQEIISDLKDLNKALSEGKDIESTYSVHAVSLYDKYMNDPKSRKLMLQEHARIEATELICQLLAEKKGTRYALAKKLGWNLDKLNLYLNGECDFHLNILAEIIGVMGYRVTITAEKI